MIYLCKAYEQMYQSLHGMYALEIFCTDNEKLAVKYAVDLSLEVMECYDDITCAIEEDYHELLDNGHEVDIQELYEDNVAFELYEVRTDKDVEEVRDDLDCLGFEDFIEEYDCVEV